jgi:alkylation response protein AidB-like acyl-CoA dehydrogenase
MCTVGVAEQDHWVLNGTKRFTTNAEIASLAVVIAVTDPEAPKNKISAFIVEKGTPGMRVGERVRTLGMRGCRTSSVHYENCRIPENQLLGERGKGFIDCLRVLDGGRISIAALSVGIAQGAYDIADAYARQRRQFNQAIIDFQAIQHKLVDMHVDTVASRLLTYQAAEAKNAGGRMSKEAAMAKLFASEACVRVADQAVQILGGNGLVREYKAEKFLRDAKLCTIGEGTSEIMKLVIGRHLQPTPEQQPALTGVQQS